MTNAKPTSLTKRCVDAMKPAQARYDAFDIRVRGFALRVHPSGRKTYRFKYVAGGRQRVVTIGEHGAPWTAELARAQAMILRGQVAGGVDPTDEAAARKAQALDQARRALTVEALIECWLVDGRAAAPNKRESSWRHDASRLRRHIIPLLGQLDVSALRRQDIEHAQREIATGATAVDVRTGKRGRAIVRGGKAAARAAILSFSACLSWAVSHDLIRANAAASVRKVAPAKRERFLSDAEAARLFDTITTMQGDGSLKRVFGDVFRLLLLTGARKTEISRLAWSEVDLDRSVIKLSDARGKNGEKAIMLNAPAAALLAARPRPSRFVFPSPTDTGRPVVGLQKVWVGVRARAELPGVRLHDLRHSFASFAAAGGASMGLIAKALGHTQTTTTERYAHFGDDPVRQLADRVGARITSGARSSPTV